jgi:hypothetical protein
MRLDLRRKTITAGFAPYAVSAGLFSLAVLLAGCPSKNDNPTTPNPPAPTDTFTVVSSATPTGTSTKTPTSTPSGTPTLTATTTPTSTSTATFTITATYSPTSTPTASATSSPTNTPTNSTTDTPTSTPSSTPTLTSTFTPTPNPTECATPSLFGDNTTNPSYYGGANSGFFVYSAFSLAGPASRTLWDVQLYTQTGGLSQTVQVGVYNTDSGNLVADSAQQTYSLSSPQWVQFNMPQPETLIPGNYILGAWFINTGAGQATVYDDPVGSNFNIISSYAGFTPAFNPSGTSNSSHTLNIYADICP